MTGDRVVLVVEPGTERRHHREIERFSEAEHGEGFARMASRCAQGASVGGAIVVVDIERSPTDVTESERYHRGEEIASWACLACHGSGHAPLPATVANEAQALAMAAACAACDGTGAEPEGEP